MSFERVSIFASARADCVPVPGPSRAALAAAAAS